MYSSVKESHHAARTMVKNGETRSSRGCAATHASARHLRWSRGMRPAPAAAPTPLPRPRVVWEAFGKPVETTARQGAPMSEAAAKLAEDIEAILESTYYEHEKLRSMVIAEYLWLVHGCGIKRSEVFKFQLFMFVAPNMSFRTSALVMS